MINKEEELNKEKEFVGENRDKNDRPIRANRGQRKFLEVSHDNKNVYNRYKFFNALSSWDNYVTNASQKRN